MLDYQWLFLIAWQLRHVSPQLLMLLYHPMLIDLNTGKKFGEWKGQGSCWNILQAKWFTRSTPKLNVVRSIEICQKCCLAHNSTTKVGHHNQLYWCRFHGFAVVIATGKVGCDMMGSQVVLW